MCHCHCYACYAFCAEARQVSCISIVLLKSSPTVVFLRTSRAGDWMRTRLTSTGAFHSFDGWTDTEQPDTVWYRAVPLPCLVNIQGLSSCWTKTGGKTAWNPGSWQVSTFDTNLINCCCTIFLVCLFVCLFVSRFVSFVCLFSCFVSGRCSALYANCVRHCVVAKRVKSL